METANLTELDPMIGQEEQLAQVNAKPRRGINQERPRCITPGCPSKGKCRDYSENLKGKQFCGYFKSTEEIWKPSR